jgi:hypothetical protein
MKTRLLAILFLAVSLAGAASAPTWTATLVRIQTDPSSGIATAYFERTVTVGDTVAKHPDGWQSVSWSLGGNATTTLSGVTLTDAQVMQFVVAIAERRRLELP